MSIFVYVRTASNWAGPGSMGLKTWLGSALLHRASPRAQRSAGYLADNAGGNTAKKKFVPVASSHVLGAGNFRCALKKVQGRTRQGVERPVGAESLEHLCVCVVAIRCLDATDIAKFMQDGGITTLNFASNPTETPSKRDCWVGYDSLCVDSVVDFGIPGSCRLTGSQ